MAYYTYIKSTKNNLTKEKGNHINEHQSTIIQLTGVARRKDQSSPDHTTLHGDQLHNITSNFRMRFPGKS